MKTPAVPFFVIFTLLLCSCATKPEPISEPEPILPVLAETTAEQEIKPIMEPEVVAGDQVSEVSDDEVVAKFDNVTITKETFKTTKTELETVVNDLNRVTFSRDYNRWLTFLSDEYRTTFSDPAVLAEVSANLPIKGIQLKTIKDYFNYVFVPSRQNMRVDDIKFVSPTRVYVIMEISPGSTAAIYIIEKFGEQWKLVPKNQ